MMITVFWNEMLCFLVAVYQCRIQKVEEIGFSEVIVKIMRPYGVISQKRVIGHFPLQSYQLVSSSLLQASLPPYRRSLD
jgi:hypothetical protein